MAWLLWLKSKKRGTELQVLRYNRRDLVTTRLDVRKELEITDEEAQLPIKDLEEKYGKVVAEEEVDKNE